ncbi:zinc metalloprotease, partial [Burkholderia multivorans]
FGPTLFSFRRGETEYGIKALPLGGFIAMPGMYPPLEATKQRVGEPAVAGRTDGAAAQSGDRLGEGEEFPPDTVPDDGLVTDEDMLGDAERRPKKRKGRLFENTMADAREMSNDEIAPGEEHRTFYALSVPKRLVVMFAGPFVNLVLGIIIMAISLMGIGVMTPTTTVATV